MSIYVIAVLVCLAIIPKEHSDRSIGGDVQFYLYTKSNPTTPYLLKTMNEANLARSSINPKNTTIIYIHGFNDEAMSKSAQLIKNEYMANGDFNVILVDWKKLAEFPNYVMAVKHVPLVGKYAGQMIKWLSDRQVISISDLHVIGFSLGAHVASFLSDEVMKTSVHKIGRITGLDPASPGWDKFEIVGNGLDKSDAAFVDIIHTNSKRYGVQIALGHADFYVNHGKVQPGCEESFHRFSIMHFSTWKNLNPKIGCSHTRAWEYFAESISNPFAFPTSICSQWDPEVQDCHADPHVYMGFAISKETRGIFLVETKSEAPYGISGVPYIKSIVHGGYTAVKKPKKQDNNLNDNNLKSVLPSDDNNIPDSVANHNQLGIDTLRNLPRVNNKQPANDNQDPNSPLIVKPVNMYNIADPTYDNNVELREGDYGYRHVRQSPVVHQV